VSSQLNDIRLSLSRRTLGGVLNKLEKIDSSKFSVITIERYSTIPFSPHSWRSTKLTLKKIDSSKFSSIAIEHFKIRLWADLWECIVQWFQTIFFKQITSWFSFGILNIVVGDVEHINEIDSWLFKIQFYRDWIFLEFSCAPICENVFRSEDGVTTIFLRTYFTTCNEYEFIT